MSNGFVKVNRKIMSHPMWLEKPFSRGQAWVDLVLLASWKDTHFVKRGIRIDQKRGTVATSMKGLSDRWGWSIGKINRFLKYLKTERQIETKIDNVTTLIVIRNYEKYQTNGNQNGNQTGDQTETIEEVKEVILYMNEKTGKRFSPKTGSTIKVIKARLSDGYTVNDCKKVIDNQHREWVGTDMEQYLRPDTLFRQSKFEGYLNNNKSGQKTKEVNLGIH